MKWSDIRFRSRSAAGQFGMEILDKVITEMIEAREVREIMKDEQVLRGLRKEGQSGALARWFELGKRS